MGNSDQLRVDRGAYQTHRDDTHANLGAFNASNDAVDRQQQHLHNMTEDGTGSSEYAASRASSRHAVDDVHQNSMKLADRTVEQADEFIGNVRNAAAKNIRSI